MIENFVKPGSGCETKSAQFTFCKRPILRRVELAFGETSGAMKRFSVAVQAQGQVYLSFLKKRLLPSA